MRQNDLPMLWEKMYNRSDDLVLSYQPAPDDLALYHDFLGSLAARGDLSFKMKCLARFVADIPKYPDKTLAKASFLHAFACLRDQVLLIHVLAESLKIYAPDADDRSIAHMIRWLRSIKIRSYKVHFHMLTCVFKGAKRYLRVNGIRRAVAMQWPTCRDMPVSLDVNSKSVRVLSAKPEAMVVDLDGVRHLVFKKERYLDVKRVNDALSLTSDEQLAHALI